MKNYLLTTALMCSFGMLVHAQKIVKGYVSDNQKEPLIGVTIRVKGTVKGTATDVSGNFTLNIANDSDTLLFSYTGYQTKEVVIGSGRLEIIMEENTTELEEVTVTGFSGAVGQARRRVESLQKIPESVATMTGDQIQATGVTNIQSFASLVPNMSFQASQNVGVNFVNVRGIAQIRNGEAPVAFVVDGVFIPDANLINQELYDLAMVEVVKGPQGTLYGKNAIGGAINILTVAPSNYFRNKINLGYGNGNTFKAQASSSGPIVKDKVYYRISGAYKKSDGIIKNETLNDEVDFLEDLSLRGQLRFDLTPRFSATIAGQYIDTEGGATYYAHSRSGTQLNANDFNNIINADQRGISTLDNTFTYLKLEYNFGNATLRSVTSYNNAQRNHVGDLDFLPTDILRQIQDSDSESFNQEFRLSSSNTDSGLSWDVGAFYQKSNKLLYTEVTADVGFFATPPAPTGQQSTFARLSDFTNEFSTIAFFGFIDYQLTNKLTVSAGLRFDSDNIKQNNRLTNTNPNKTQSELQPKVSLSYQANNNILVYGNYGRGYRSGGFNSEATDLFDPQYEGETSNNFELGLKTSTANNRFIFNLAAFYIDFKNQQQYAVAFGQSGLLLGNYNFPKSTITGFEADLKFRTSKYLDIIAGFGYTKAEVKEGGTNGNIDRTGFVGNITPFVPQTTFNIALQSDFPLSKTIDFLGFLSFTHKGKIYWHEDNNDVADPYGLLDGRLGISIHKKYNITIWGANILATDYYQEYFAGEISGSAAGDIAWIGKPTTFGIEVAIKL